MLLEKLPVCIKGQAQGDFHHPFWVGECSAGEGGTSQGSMKTWVPFPSPPHSATLPMDSGRTGASAGHSGFPLARRWQGGQRRAGQVGRGCSGSVWVKSRVRSQGLQPAELRFRDPGKGCGRRDDWLMISGGGRGRAGEIPWLRKVPVSCMLHAEDSGDWAGDRKQPLCQLNLPLLGP